MSDEFLTVFLLLFGLANEDLEDQNGVWMMNDSNLNSKRDISIEILSNDFLKFLSEIDKSALSMDELHCYADMLKTVSEIKTGDPLTKAEFTESLKSGLTPEYPMGF